PKSLTCDSSMCVWCGVVWFGVVWCGVVWCGGAQPGLGWECVSRRGGVGGVGCTGVQWGGVVWCGSVWCGVVWCGVVWYLWTQVEVAVHRQHGVAVAAGAEGEELVAGVLQVLLQQQLGGGGQEGVLAVRGAD